MASEENRIAEGRRSQSAPRRVLLSTPPPPPPPPADGTPILKHIVVDRSCITILGYAADDYECECCDNNIVTAQVVSVDGGCRDNGKPQARSAIGVHFGENTHLNISRCLPGEGPGCTSQKAELEACKAALETLVALKEGGHKELPFPWVIIRADSEYVVKGMTEWIYNWRGNGFKNSRRQSVTNGSLFSHLDDLIELLDYRGVEVLFWHVPREQNEDADKLVNAAFDAQ